MALSSPSVGLLTAARTDEEPWVILKHPNAQTLSVQLNRSSVAMPSVPLVCAPHIRRAMIQDIATLAIHYAKVTVNTSEVRDPILTHKLCLAPIFGQEPLIQELEMHQDCSCQQSELQRQCRPASSSFASSCSSSSQLSAVTATSTETAAATATGSHTQSPKGVTTAVAPTTTTATFPLTTQQQQQQQPAAWSAAPTQLTVLASHPDWPRDVTQDDQGMLLMGCPRCSIMLRLDVDNQTNECRLVTTRDLQIDPVVLRRFPQLATCTDDQDGDLVLVKLGPYQRILADLCATKGTGLKHAKWTPVTKTAAVDAAQIRIQRAIWSTPASTVADIETLASSCPKQVFGIQETGATSELVVVNETACDFCNQCVKQEYDLGKYKGLDIRRQPTKKILHVRTKEWAASAWVLEQGLRQLKHRVDRFITDLQRLRQQRDYGLLA